MIRRADDVLNAYAIISISITSLLMSLQAAVSQYANNKGNKITLKTFLTNKHQTVLI